jgi:hypothetical protein
MAFTFQPYSSPLTSSIADRLAQQGAIEAQRAYASGNAAANAALQSGNAWSGAIQGVGQAIGALPGQIAALQGAEQNRAIRQQQLQQGAIQLGAAQRQQQGEQAVANLMQGDQLPADQAGPRMASYLDENGLYDVPKLTARLGALGYGDRAADLVKGAETINDSITRHQATQAQLAKDQTILAGDMAHGTLTLMTSGMPIDQAMDISSSAAVTSGSFSPAQYAKVRTQILGLPPEQQQAALEGLRNQAAKLAPTKTLAEGATETDRYGRTVAKGGEKPQDFTLGEGQIRYDKDGNPVAWGPDKPKPKLTLEEAEKNAYALSIGKPDASALSYADLQTFDKNKQAIQSDAGFQTHVRERLYDNAHPTPDKPVDQNKLEQQGRALLTRAVSTRSGGIGLENAKVQQANHLLGLLDATYDPKSGSYNIPPTQQTELALGLATLISPGGVVGAQMLNEINQRTAKGDLAGALTYLTGTPVAATPQAIAQMYKDSIQRQGTIAEQNREGGMGYLRGLMPTELDPSRAAALESTNLTPLRQSRVIQNNQTSARKLQVSIDGGKTWQ